MEFIKETKFEGICEYRNAEYRGVYYVEEYATKFGVSFRPFGFALPVVVDYFVSKTMLSRDKIDIYEYINRIFHCFA